MSRLRAAREDRLPAYSLFAAVLSGAGLPIYIYAPAHYASSYGVSLTTLGAVLFGLRLLDVVQDPLFGWISERMRRGRAGWVSLVSVLLGVSMVGLFAVDPLIAPVWWFALTITGLFSAFSFLTINFYAQGVRKSGAEGQVRLAAWRESGALLGVCVAAVVPTALALVSGTPFAIFGWGYAALAVLAAAAMWPEWSSRPILEPVPLHGILADARARRLLVLALVNAAPVAVSSTLFVFFVDARLEAEGWDGPLLLIFFLAAALSAPLWSALAGRFGIKPVLLAAMGLAVASFGFTLTLGPGDQLVFAAISLAAGASIGADLTLLPAAFAARLARLSPNGAAGFGLWSFMSKFTLALAAGLLLPAIEAAGFRPGGSNGPEALRALTWGYAAVPIVLKLVAMALLARLRLD